MPIATKQCTRCGETKKVTQFHRDPSSRDGFNTWCGACQNEHTAAYNRRKRAEARKQRPSSS